MGNVAACISVQKEEQIGLLPGAPSCCRGVDVKCALHVVDLIATCLPHNRPYMHIDAVHVCDVNIFDMGLLFADSSRYSRQPVVFHSTIFRKDKSFHTHAFQ